MTHTITLTRCMDCPMYAQKDVEDCMPAMCLHKDSGWDDLKPYDGPGGGPVRPQVLSIPPNCPLLQTPVTYRAERKG